MKDDSLTLMLLEKLQAFPLEVLEHLPTEPVGLSIHELADGLLDAGDPVARGRVRRALEEIDSALGGLSVGHGDDDFGHYAVEMYGIRRNQGELVREFFRDRSVHADKPRPQNPVKRG